ncbi:rhomboid family intramembrane serine protease [Microbacterium gorillae]|uniref:rhomboid family intramembrane serine protease n=1 Tax=Microbacterium gorillae TaxID=1231063 RepID=UPI0005908258|nr:rhomboid family intramembrane serine protease [Microbacterium gorillae]
MSSADFSRNSDNYCYRHPDRVSFVLCQRCLRTICHECQTPGPVGVVCPECMKEQKQSRTPAQKKAERRWTRGPDAVAASGFRGLPVTYTIIAVTVVISLLQMIPGGFGDTITSFLAFQGWRIDPGLPSILEPWRALTVLLVHGGIIHLGLNMLSLWMIGRILEPMLGRGRFLTLYLIAGLSGSVVTALIDPNQVVVGASGAIFGTLGAIIVITRRLGGDIRGILIVVGLNLVIGFFPGLSIAWQAHVGGLIGGLVVGAIYAATRQRSKRGLQIGLLAGFVVVLILATFLIPVLHPFALN